MTLLQRTARQVADVFGRNSGLVRHARPIYERTLSALSTDGGIPWTINGEPFRISPFHRHRMGHVYDPSVAAWLAERVRPGDVCFDIGANVGVYALQFARWIKGHGRVVAFEPNPTSADALRRHLAMNGFSRYTDVVQKAVASRCGVQTFHMAGADGMSRLGEPNPALAGRTRVTEVEVITVDDYRSKSGLNPDWMLIDVEGFEFEVLAGARRTLARRGAELTVVVEMHPDAWEVAGWTRPRAEAFVDSLGLRVQALSGQADPFGSYGHVLLENVKEGARA